jgi:hypothetical protein
VLRKQVQGMRNPKWPRAPVFHMDTDMVAELSPFLMKDFADVARPVARALTPRQNCSACRHALLPLPLVPLTKFTFGLPQAGHRASTATH